jgi:hypothetical protein
MKTYVEAEVELHALSALELEGGGGQIQAPAALSPGVGPSSRRPNDGGSTHL